MRIVLCDDHELFLRALTATLESRGHRVTATTALPALDGNGDGNGDGVLDGAEVCVLDLRLGDGSGITLAGSVRRRRPDLPLLLLSASLGAHAWAAYDSGLVDGLVSKACPVEVLERAIARLAAGGRVVEGGSRPARPARARYDDTLTEREREVLLLIVGGAGTPAIAAALGVSGNTVRTHVQNLMRKLDVSHRTMAVQRAVEMGMCR